MQAEDPYAGFISGRGGLCIAKEVSLLYNDRFLCLCLQQHMKHMQ